VSTGDTREAWRAIAERYRQLSATRESEGLGVQLACLVLAEYCAHLWVGSSSGPSRAMVAITEHIVGDRVDEIVAAELAKIAEQRKHDRERRLS
jgi:hypothetical protein